MIGEFNIQRVAA